MGILWRRGGGGRGRGEGRGEGEGRGGEGREGKGKTLVIPVCTHAWPKILKIFPTY